MQWLANKILACFGWKVVGQLPKDKKFVLIVAPHTSNWDFLVGIFARFAVGRKINFLAKSQLFIFPLNLLFKSLGGYPVIRTQSNDLVEQVVSLYKSQDEFIIGLTPEGTRSPVERWKTGFYHITEKADVPLVMVGLDYAKKEVVIREPYLITHHIEQDFQQILGFFRSITGRYPKHIPDFVPK